MSSYAPLQPLHIEDSLSTFLQKKGIPNEAEEMSLNEDNIFIDEPAHQDGKIEKKSSQKIEQKWKATTDEGWGDGICSGPVS